MKPYGISAIHEFHEKNDAVFIEVGGWLMPKKYDGVEDETDAVKNFVGIHDISSKAKLIVHGVDIVRILSGEFKLLSGFNCKVKLMESVTYGFQLILAELTSKEYLVVVEPEFKNVITEICMKDNYCVDISSGLTGIRLIGPKASEIISTVSSFDIRNKMFPDLSVAQISLMHLHAYLLRMDVANSLCYDIFVARDVGLFVWNQIIILGEPFGISAIGTQVMDEIASDGVIF